MTSAYSRRSDINPGISCSASSISLRPKSATTGRDLVLDAVANVGAQRV
ncbi:hypothetical protein I552_0293, partial [Mycobacterium xenopi 3993]